MIRTTKKILLVAVLVLNFILNCKLFFSYSFAYSSTQVIDIYSDFNFISFNIDLDTDVIAFKNSYPFIEDIFYYHAKAQQFVSIQEKIDYKKGYIVKAKNAGKIVILGNKIESLQISLEPGFNIICIPMEVKNITTFKDLMLNNAEILGLYKWIPSASDFIQVIRVQDQIIELNEINPKIKSGESYFINVKSKLYIKFENNEIKFLNTVITPTEKVKKPYFNPSPGTYPTTQLVEILCDTIGAKIYYTIDGSNPTPSTGYLYQSPILINSFTVIKAIAIKDGMLNSDLVEGTYEIKVLPLKPSLNDLYTDIIIPEVETIDGGIQSNPMPNGSVYYFSSVPNVAGIKEESDIQLDDNIVKLNQTVKRYMRVKGKALPIAAGFQDRFYHSVTFTIINDATNQKVATYSLPVDLNNEFDGYIYFTAKGNFRVYSYRARNDMLYPKSVLYAPVPESYSTLVFYVDCIEEVPADKIFLLPTREVNCGNKYLRDYAKYLTFNLNTDLEKAKKIFEFLVFGDENGKFEYTLYSNIFPGILDNSWNSIFLPSHFIIRRKGVCNDYAELYAALCRAIGLNVKRKSGEDINGSGHQWNLIYINNKWYQLDATWANYNQQYYKEFAEFYSEFNAVDFFNEHEKKYFNNIMEEY